MNSRWLLAILFVVFCGALALRVPHLDLRPMHGDEAVHAVKFNELWSKGEYRYDPREYHGPILYDFALPVVKISGASNFAALTATTLRLVPACLGALIIGWLWLLRDGFGKNRDTILWAALFTALSPVMVFYSRYFIQEIPLVFFSAGFIACLWRARQSSESRPRQLWLLGAGLNGGLMLASKETAIIVFACVALSWFFTLRVQGGEEQHPTVGGRDWGLVFVVALGVAVCLLSNFGRSLPDFKTASLAASTYVSRAGGQESQGELHRHVWFKYFEWLLWYRGGAGPRWSEAFIALFALIGLGMAFGRQTHAPLARFWAVYTLAMMAVYSVLPYKTPWCALGFWHGAIVLAGFGVSQILALPLRIFAAKPMGARLVQGAVLLFVGAGCWNLYQQVQLSNTRFFADRRNPWVYAHPTRDVLRLGERVQQLAELDSRKKALPMVVIAPKGDYWPLPWELRAQSQVGYFNSIPDLNGARMPIIIVAQANIAELYKQMGAEFESDYRIEYYGLRPGKVFGLCVETALWEKFLHNADSG
ncbi:TIGR03663 family protein [bacterium]|nr:MAG: TIGR03663 family protein [bacterium]